MRKLTVKRDKTFVACLASVTVCLEDATSDELTVNGVPCRRLGRLKNGEEKTFDIPHEAVKVFVIADKFSKDYCNDMYQIPAGEEDIFLHGQNRFEPSTGNAFHFADNTDPHSIEKRKVNKRTGRIVLCSAILFGVLIGFVFSRSIMIASHNEKDQTVSIDEMRITLTQAFKRVDDERFQGTYATKDVACFVLKEPFSLAEGLEDRSIEEYMQAVLENNQKEGAEPVRKNGLYYFEYDAALETGMYHYVTYTFRSQKAFWRVTFAVETDDFDRYAQQIEKWASSVTFEE